MVKRFIFEYFMLCTLVTAMLFESSCIIVDSDCEPMDASCNAGVAAVLTESFLPAGPLSSPTELSGLALWLDAGSLSGFADGDPVNSWQDTGPNLFTAVAAAAPTYRAAATNGRPALQFNGTTQYLDIPYDARLNTANFTLLIVMAGDGSLIDGAFRAPINSRYDPVPSISGYNIYKDDSNHYSLWLGATPTSPAWRTYPQTAVVDNNWTVLTARYSSNLDVNVSLRRDGGLIAAGVLTDYIPNTVRLMRIGAGEGSGTPVFFWPGSIAEVVLYNFALTDADRVRVECYIATKYAIAVQGCS